MIELGGLYDKSEIKILILYILDEIKKPVDLRDISEALLSEGLCDYFLTQLALEEIQSTGHAICNNDQLALTALGQSTAKELCSSVSIVARERGLNALYLLLAKKENDKLSQVTIEKTQNGFEVCLSLNGDSEKLMQLKLFVPNEMQAGIIKNAFKKSPEKTYYNILSNLMK